MKKYLGFLTTAWVGVATHKLRSFLTILGVMIGVGAVIALMSIGKGVETTIVSSIQNLGSNLLFIQPGSTTTQGGVQQGQGSAQTLILEDAEAVKEEVQHVTAAAAVVRFPLQVIVGSNNIRTNITGITPDYQQVLNLELAEGDFISQYMYDSAMRVVILGPNAKNNLFGEEEALDQQIRITTGFGGGVVCRVVGVLQSKGTSMFGSTDDAILMPYPTLRQTIFAGRNVRQTGNIVNSIIISVDDQSNNSLVVQDITELLRTRHNIAIDAANDFQITSQEDIIKFFSQATASMTLLLGAIAAISLLVGGIGVMNIMLVSVVERTREIGVRKALGAQEKDIWMQFLAEAAFLTFSGGIIGITLGWVASELVKRGGTLNTVVTPDMVILAVSVSIGIGLFFGFYPAWNASRLNPIEALRSE